jgi:hypothetical protein
MAPELIDHFVLKSPVAKPGGAPPQPVCAGWGWRTRRNPRGRRAAFHQHCWFTIRRSRRPWA